MRATSTLRNGYLGRPEAVALAVAQRVHLAVHALGRSRAVAAAALLGDLPAGAAFLHDDDEEQQVDADGAEAGVWKWGEQTHTPCRSTCS